MLKAEFEVCTDCGTLHMEGGAGPDRVDECANCGGRVADVELDDLVGL
jgi:rRNA maturation endonuclease Nob1